MCSCNAAAVILQCVRKYEKKLRETRKTILRNLTLSTPHHCFLLSRYSQDFPTLMWYTFSKDTIVEKVEIKPKRNTEVDNAQWQVITINDCDPDSSSWTELKSGKMTSRPVPGRPSSPVRSSTLSFLFILLF